MCVNAIFHYYATKLLAMRAGFSESDAQVIAFSSQLVDRSLIPFRVTYPGSKSEYSITQTHHFGFWDKKQEEQVWIPFHFFPSGDGNTSTRADGRAHHEQVLPNSIPVKELLIQALKSKDLYRIGIALHTYADSWAHQNFVGRNIGFNRSENLSPIPPVGHAHVRRQPDIWSLTWIDPRLDAEHQIVDNEERFMAAAEKMYKYLATYNRRSFTDWEMIRWELEELIHDGKPDSGNTYPKKNRVAEDHFLQLEFRLKLENEELDPLLWFRDAFAADSEQRFALGYPEKFAVARHEVAKLLKISEQSSVQAAADFEDRDLFKWSEAATAHKIEAKRILSQL